jgi:hypothetical protein
MSGETLRLQEALESQIDSIARYNEEDNLRNSQTASNGAISSTERKFAKFMALNTGKKIQTQLTIIPTSDTVTLVSMH